MNNKADTEISRYTLDEKNDDFERFSYKFLKGDKIQQESIFYQLDSLVRDA
jgi:hypothetical protein